LWLNNLEKERTDMVQFSNLCYVTRSKRVFGKEKAKFKGRKLISGGFWWPLVPFGGHLRAPEFPSPQPPFCGKLDREKKGSFWSRNGPVLDALSTTYVGLLVNPVKFPLVERGAAGILKFSARAAKRGAKNRQALPKFRFNERTR